MVHGSVCPFPFVEMLHALLPIAENMTTESSALYNDITELNIEPSPWLLYAVLNISAQYLGELSNRDECQV